jgi:hypothetical protein
VKGRPLPSARSQPRQPPGGRSVEAEVADGPSSDDSGAESVMKQVLGNVEFQNGCWIRIQNRTELLGKYRKARDEAARIGSLIGKQLD